MGPTVALSLYSDDATAGNWVVLFSFDNNAERSPASELTFVEADRPNKTWNV